jgi:hypothetical protein
MCGEAGLKVQAEVMTDASSCCCRSYGSLISKWQLLRLSVSEGRGCKIVGPMYDIRSVRFQKLKILDFACTALRCNGVRQAVVLCLMHTLQYTCSTLRGIPSGGMV